MFEDELIIGAYFYGNAERVIDIVDFARNLLKEIEKISPWSQPFDVSGYTKATSDLLVKEDLSNFNDVLLKVWKSSDRVYYDLDGTRTLEISENYSVKTGLRVTFSNFIQSQDESNRVSISLHMGQDHIGLASKNVPNNVLISVPKYRSGQINNSWAQKEVVEGLMRYLIDLVKPYQCAAFSSRNTVSEVDGRISLYKFNWLTYISVPEVCDLLSDSTFARECDEGLWFDFGNDVNTVATPCVKEAAMDINRRLIGANLESKRF